MTTAILHPFEAAGLGQAPFRYVGMVESRAPVGDGHFKPGSSCDYCGTAIRYCCKIRSVDGRTFKVGTDCVFKTCIEVDTSLALAVRKAMADLAYEKREAKRRAEWEKLSARLTAARAILAVSPSLFADRPHPNAYFASQGLTLRDYYEFLMKSGGESGRVSACRAIEVASDRAARSRE